MMRPALRIALICFVLGLAWIWGTDMYLSYTNDQPFIFGQSIKGSIFVLGMSITIYLLIRNAKRQILHQEKSYRGLYIDNPEPILILDKSNESIIDANPSALAFYRYTAEQLRSMKYSALLVHPTEEVKSERCQHYLADRTTRYVDLKVSQITYKGQQATMIVVHDVNEQEELKNALLQRESMIDSLVKTDHSFLVRLDASGQIEFANQLFTTYHSHLFSTFQGQNFEAIFSESDRSRVREAFDKAMKNPGSTAVFSAYTMGENSTSSTRTTWEILAVQDALNTLQGYIATGRDHAELDEIRAEVTKTESRLDLLLDSIKDGFFIVDFEMRVDIANRAFSELLNLPVEEIVGKKLSEIIPQWKNTQSSIELPKALLSGQQISYEAYNPFFDKWLEISAIPFEKGLAVFYHDISRVKQNELLFKRNEINLQSLINNTRDFVWSFDNRYKILTSNAAVKRLGEEVFEISMAPGESLFPEGVKPELLEKFQVFYDRVLRGEVIEERLNMEEYLGVTYHVELTMSPIRDSEDFIIGGACFARDITEREIHRIALNKALERHQVISEVTRDAIWDYLVSEDRLSWSDGLNTSFHYDLKETSLEWWEERVHPEDIEKAVFTFNQALNSTDRSWMSRYRFLNAKGEYVPVIDRGVLIRDDKGNPTRAVGSIQDLTELEQYRQEVNTLSIAMSRTTVGVMLTDTEGRIEWANSAYIKLSGNSLSEMKGKKQSEVMLGIHSDQALMNRLEEAFEKQKDVTLEMQNYGKDGGAYWIRINVSPIVENDRIIRFLALITDITEERKINARLITQNENLKKIAFILSHELRKPVSSVLGLLELYNEEDSANSMNADIIKYMKKATEELDDMIHDIIRQSALIDD